jgi:hypothetical protein
MISTQANRTYGPPDGITTGEFDSLTRPIGGRELLYRLPAPAASTETVQEARRYTIILVRGRHFASFLRAYRGSKRRTGGPPGAAPQTTCRPTIALDRLRQICHTLPEFSLPPFPSGHFGRVHCHANNLPHCLRRGRAAAHHVSGRVRGLEVRSVEYRLTARRPRRRPRTAALSRPHHRRQSVSLGSAGELASANGMAGAPPCFALRPRCPMTHAIQLVRRLGL